MANDEHVSELIPGYVLDCLEEAELIQADEHLAICPQCQAEMAANQKVVGQLGMAAPDVACPGDLKDRLMTRIGAAPVTEVSPRPSWWDRLRELFRRTAPTWGLASALLVVVLLASNLVLLQRVEPSNAMDTIILSGTDTYPDGVGIIVVGVHGDEGALVVDSLASLDIAHQYQLWLIKDGERSSGGVFSVDEDGYAVIWLESEEPLVNYEAFGVTIEPAGGSHGPTGDKVLGGSF
jgi:anti-sigma-K factor RskA